MSNQTDQNQPNDSSRKSKKNEKVDVKVEKEEELVLNRYPKENNIAQSEPPQSRDEQSVSGHMPDPEGDDDTLEAAKKTGLYTEATEEEPVKVGIAEQVDKAEQERRSKKTE